MDLQQAYRNKRRAAAAIVAEIAPGATLVTNGGTGLPNAFLAALAAQASELSDVRLCHPMRREAMPLTPELVSEVNQGHVWHISDYTYDRPVIEGIRAGLATYRPNHPPDAARFFPYPVDLLVVAASPMDSGGFFSLGAFGGWIWAFVAKAKRIVLEVNPNQPRVLGECQIHLDRVEAVIEADYPLTSIQQSALVPGPDEIAIAGHVAPLVRDGATLQAGVGQIPDALLRILKDSGRRDLGVHSEAMFDSFIELYEAGVITNARKTVNRSRFSCALAIGSKKLYGFLHDNPAVEMRDIAYICDPRVIARNHRPFSLNATIQIDLFGQCASETVGPLHYSGTGGQWCFHYGAALAEEGCSVVTLLSTARKGTLSRIVPMLPAGSAVTIGRNDVHHVATEQGLASLKGRTLEERARALIAIAHPDFREDLERAARDDLKLLRRRLHPAGAAS